MGKINTNTLLLVGAAAVGVYLLTRPKAPLYNPYSTGLPVYNPYPTGLPANASNPLAQDVTAGASALSSLSDLIGNFF
jgi:hypothetical protein